MIPQGALDSFHGIKMYEVEGENFFLINLSKYNKKFKVSIV